MQPAPIPRAKAVRHHRWLATRAPARVLGPARDGRLGGARVATGWDPAIREATRFSDQLSLGGGAAMELRSLLPPRAPEVVVEDVGQSRASRLLERGEEEGQGEAQHGHEAHGRAAVLEGLGHHGVGQHGEDGSGGEGLDGGDDVAGGAPQ